MTGSVPHALPAICACLVIWCAAPAAAQPEAAPAQPDATSALPGDDDEAWPWAHGVSGDEQEAARKIHAQGNAEFAESRFAQALAKYREAIRHWDHPAIRFNMAVCLINLGQLLDARDNLERSLMYGAAPLGTDLYTQGLSYRTRLDGQLAHVEARCSEPGAIVTLDGKYLFTAPGSAQQHVLPGEHQVSAAKPGFRAAQATFDAAAAKHVRYDLQPVPELAQRRWRYWRHLLAAGGVVTGAGALAYLSARSDFAGYDDAVTRECQKAGELPGCSAEQLHDLPDLPAIKHRAEIKQTVAFSLFAAGGAAVLAGVFGLIVDQPRIRAEPGRAVPVVTPVPGGAALALAWTY